MATKLLIAAGVVQVLVTVLHVGIFFGIASSTELTEANKVMAHIFNAAVTVTVAFFAYVSLFRRRELLATGLGRATCLFMGVFYLQRGLVEVVVRGFNPVSFGLLVAIAALYPASLLASRSFDPERQPAA